MEKFNDRRKHRGRILHLQKKSQSRENLTGVGKVNEESDAGGTNHGVQQKKSKKV